MGAFLKKRSKNKYMVIHDLSWHPRESINSGIADDCSVKYISIYTFTSEIKDLNVKGVDMSRIDLEDAYTFIYTHQSDWELLGSTLDIRQRWFIKETILHGLYTPVRAKILPENMLFICRVHVCYKKASQLHKMYI